MKRYFLSTVLFLCTLSSFSQDCFTLRYFGLTIHPFGDDQASLQPYKLDKHSHFVANIGLFAGYEHFVWEDIVSVKVLQCAFTDCSAGLAGLTHIGLRGLVLEKQRHRLWFGLGPAFYYRQDWNRFPEYVDKSTFNRAHSKYLGDIQYKLFWYGCEFEYDYRINDRLDFNAGFTPGAPLVLTYSAGVKYWLNKNFKKQVRLVAPQKKRGHAAAPPSL